MKIILLIKPVSITFQEEKVPPIGGHHPFVIFHHPSGRKIQYVNMLGDTALPPLQKFFLQNNWWIMWLPHLPLYGKFVKLKESTKRVVPQPMFWLEIILFYQHHCDHGSQASIMLIIAIIRGSLVCRQ